MNQKLDENKINFQKIENKTNTDLFNEYLENIIVDEMILNSFIRHNKVAKITDDSIFFLVPSLEIKKVIMNAGYLEYYKQASIDILNDNKNIYFITDISEIDNFKTKSNLKSKNISPRLNFDNYVIGKFNKDVVEISKKIVDHAGKFSPFFITSASGLGKTHLLHAIGNLFKEKQLRAIYIEPNSFTRDITDKSRIGGSAVSEYIDEILEHDVLLFDDIQNLGDRKVTSKVLFNIFNQAIESEKQIVIVADKKPNELFGFEERFITRFQSGLTSRIEFPNSVDLIKILKFKLDEKELDSEKWDEKALNFIARNNSSSIRSIEGAVKRVAYFKLSKTNIKYTFTTISNIFKELSIDEAELTPERVIKTVSRYYKLKPNDIIGKSRKANIVLARHMSIYLIKLINDLPYKQIGKIIGGRDHSTIMAAENKIKIQMKLNGSIKLALKKLENNIKKIS